MSSIHSLLFILAALGNIGWTQTYLLQDGSASCDYLVTIESITSDSLELKAESSCDQSKKYLYQSDTEDYCFWTSTEVLDTFQCVVDQCDGITASLTENVYGNSDLLVEITLELQVGTKTMDFLFVKQPLTDSELHQVIADLYQRIDELDSKIAASESVSEGNLVQIQHMVSSTKVVTTATTAWQEPSTDYRITITPKYNDSLIVVHTHFGWNGFGIATNTVVLWSSARGIDVATSDPLDRVLSALEGETDPDRHHIYGMAQRRSNGYDSNDQNYNDWTIFDEPNTLLPVTYGIHLKVEASGNGQISVGRSNLVSTSNGWTYTMPVTMIAYEYRN